MTILSYRHSVTENNIIEDNTFDGVEVQMTWGGGMGGSCKTFYGVILGNNENEFEFYDVLKGEKIKLSYNFKVFERPVKIVTSTIKEDGKNIKYVYALHRNEPYEFSREYDTMIYDKKYYVGVSEVYENQPKDAEVI